MLPQLLTILFCQAREFTTHLCGLLLKLLPHQLKFLCQLIGLLCPAGFKILAQLFQLANQAAPHRAIFQGVAGAVVVHQPFIPLAHQVGDRFNRFITPLQPAQGGGYPGNLLINNNAAPGHLHVLPVLAKTVERSLVDQRGVVAGVTGIAFNNRLPEGFRNFLRRFRPGAARQHGNTGRQQCHQKCLQHGKTSLASGYARYPTPIGAVATVTGSLETGVM